MQRTPRPTIDTHAVAANRRTVLWGLPAVAAALATPVAGASASTPQATPADARHSPAYRESDLMRRYYRLARF